MLSKSTVSELSDTLSQEYEAWRTRDLSQEPLAYLFIDMVYEPLRRWGNKTGVLCVWAICEDGGKVLLSLFTTNSERDARCVEVLRGLVKRGMQPPVTITTDGAIGLTKAIDAIWPKSLRIRCWFHKMQNLQQKVPRPAWPGFNALIVDMRDAPIREKAEDGIQAEKEVPRAGRKPSPPETRTRDPYALKRGLRYCPIDSGQAGGDRENKQCRNLGKGPRRERCLI